MRSFWPTMTKRPTEISPGGRAVRYPRLVELVITITPEISRLCWRLSSVRLMNHLLPPPHSRVRTWPRQSVAMSNLVSVDGACVGCSVAVIPPPTQGCKNARISGVQIIQQQLSDVNNLQQCYWVTNQKSAFSSLLRSQV